MKYENLIYGTGSILVIAGAIMKILHIPFGNGILMFGFISTSIYQSWYVVELKKRIKDLEKKLSARES